MDAKDSSRIIERIKDNLSILMSQGVTGKDINKTLDPFKEKKKNYHMGLLKSNILLIKEADIDIGENNKEFISIARTLDPFNFSSLKDQLAHLEELLKDVPQKDLDFQLKLNLPPEIRDDIRADIIEINKCFDASCYRSVAILCGRLLEIALHRKYYEATGIDLLEKSPGIGLGKIIAKLSEKQVELDPGLSQQIHLINQVRVFSVHVKQNAFSPNRNQAHAMVLYTLDILEKLFS